MNYHIDIDRIKFIQWLTGKPDARVTRDAYRANRKTTGGNHGKPSGVAYTASANANKF